MIQYLISKENRVAEISQAQEGSWINVVNPTHEEKQILLYEYDIDDYFLEGVLDKEEVSRTEIDEGKTYFIVSIPIRSEVDKEFYTTIPLGIVIAKDYVMTISLDSEKLLAPFRENRMKNFQTNYKTRFILRILLSISNLYIRDLRNLRNLTDEYEDQLYTSVENNELMEMLQIEKSLVYFSTAIRSNQLVLERLLKTDSLKRYPEDDELLEDAITENRQALEMCKVYTNLMSSTVETFASIISNNQNTSMKQLTLITIFMSLPSIVSGLYGMNVLLPFADHPYAFWILVLIIVVLSIALILILRKSKMYK